MQYYVNYQQNNWIQLLLVDQLAYNNATTKTILVSSFFANYSYYLVIIQKSQIFAKIAQKVLIKVLQMQTLYDKLQKNI